MQPPRALCVKPIVITVTPEISRSRKPPRSVYRFVAWLYTTKEQRAPFQPDVTNEVSEHRGVLLVRLGRGSAMQVRVSADGASVLYRTVPIAQAMHVEDDSRWQFVSDAQLRGWIERNSAIGCWLLTKGFRYHSVAGQLTEVAAIR